MNNEYMNDVYKTNIQCLHSSLWIKTMAICELVTVIVLFSFRLRTGHFVKGSRTGHFVMVSLWYASLLTNTRFHFLYFRLSSC